MNLEGPDRLLTVANPRVGGPAYLAGVCAGDRIIAVDGRPTDKMELPDIVHLLRGDPGDPVTISVRRGDQPEPIDFRLTRTIIKIDSILGDHRLADGTWDCMLPGDERLGYIRLTTFGETTVEELDAALAALKARKCRGLVLDLRNNPGGLLQVAERVCDLFLPAGAPWSACAAATGARCRASRPPDGARIKICRSSCWSTTRAPVPAKSSLPRCKITIARSSSVSAPGAKEPSKT